MAPITQPETYQIFPKAMQQVGTRESASAVVPEGVYGVTITSEMSAGDASNVAHVMLIVIESSIDNGLTWQPLSMTDWQGGTHFDKTTQSVQPNHIGWAVSVNQAWTGRRARIRVDLPQRLNFGLTLTVTPPELDL